MALNEEKLRKLWPNAKSLEIAQVRQALVVLGYQLPMFAIIASALRIRITEKVETAAINRYGVCFVNPKFVQMLTMPELAFVMAHESLHLITSTLERQQHRESTRWNRAADRAINQVLLEISQDRHADVLAIPEKVKPLFPLTDEQKLWEAERLYDVEPETPVAVVSAGGSGSGKGKSVGNKRPQAGQGCGVDTDLPNNEGEGEDLDPDTAKRNPELIWRAMGEMARSLGAGTQAGQALARIIEPPKARISWARLVRHTISQVLAWPGRDDQSWQRRNRRYYGSSFLMPGYISARKNICIIVDTSGSMSDKAVARCVSEVVAASSNPAIRLYLVVHDAEVQWKGWLQPSSSLPAVWKCMKGRGGTIFDPAYQAVSELRDKFDALVHLTDGGCFGQWPARPKNVAMAVAALVGYGSLDSAPENFKKVLVDPEI